MSSKHTNSKPLKGEAVVNLSEEDSVIRSSLTPKQLAAIDVVVQEIIQQTNDEYSYEGVSEAICYGLLNPRCFKASGQDFVHKLNAIRAVYFRDFDTSAFRPLVLGCKSFIEKGND